MLNNGASREDRTNLTAPPAGALHENLVRSEEIIGPSNRRFGLMMGAAFIVIGFVPRSSATFIPNGGWALGLSLLLSPYFGRPR